MPPRICLLTNGHPYSLQILTKLSILKGKIDVFILMYESATPKHLVDRIKSIRSRMAVARGLKETQSTFPDVIKKTFLSAPLNSDRMIRELEMLEIDYLILGGCGIINSRVINSAKMGVINGHPALLPWMRNVGVVGRSLLQGIPLGASIHYVESGIDTGPLIERRLLRPHSSLTTLKDCENACYGLAAEMIAKTVADDLMNSRTPAGLIQQQKFPLTTWLSESERSLLDKKISDGLANEIFARALPMIPDKELLTIPDDFAPTAA